MISTKSTTFDKLAKIWHGPEPVVPLFNPDCSLGRTLFYTMKLNPKAIALQSDTENTTVTYEELLRDSIRIAQHLKYFAPKQDDIVGIVSQHTTYATHLLCASWFNATVAHPLDGAYEQAVVQHIYSKTRPKIIFCEGKYYEKVLNSCKAIQLEAPIYTINDHIEGVRSILDLMKPTDTESSYEPENLIHGGDQTICIINSSGTSGMPKVICKSNYSLSTSLHIRDGDITFNYCTIDTISGIVYVINTIKVCAKRIITTAPYTTEYLSELLEKYKISNMLICPSYISSLVNAPDIQQSLTNLRIISFGGSNIMTAVYQKLRKLLRPEQKSMVIYTLSEFTGSIAWNLDTKKPQASGQLLPGVQVKIIADDGRSLGVGEIGEILAYNGKTWKGYYNDTAATRDMCDNELWFHTGDLGYFDQVGDLFIVNRKNVIMRYRGVQYAPQEIEQVIAQLPSVEQVCVFGHTNDLEGDRPAAAIVIQKNKKLTESEVIQYVAKHFKVEWKHLHGGVFFLSSLPITANGKIMRHETKRRALQQLIQSSSF